MTKTDKLNLIKKISIAAYESGEDSANYYRGVIDAIGAVIWMETDDGKEV